MAMVLDAFVAMFSEYVIQMERDEVGMLLGVPGEIEKLGQTVGGIQRVLADAENKKVKSKAIQYWLMQLKDVMYDADDIMDLCQIKAQERLARSKPFSSSKVGHKFLNPLSCCRNPFFAHEIGTKIREINLRLEGIAKQKADLGLIESQNIFVPYGLGREVKSIINLKTNPSIIEGDIVGENIEEDTRLIVNWLTEEQNVARQNVDVVAIVGMGGIGKTTLAKRIFNDPKIQEEFTLQIWACVSKEVKYVELLKCIIREVGGDHGAAQEISELVPLLHRIVQGKKFLLVLDDVWEESRGVWDELLRVPMMKGAHGSRLLVTTRDERVANGMRAAQSHHVEKLCDEDGWSLLIKQVFHNEEESEIQEFKDIGLQLVERCDGLPLAIKSIGGVLCMKGRTINEWQAVLESNVWSWSTDGLPDDLHHAFYLSYEDLPSPLKQCFIFCSLYPEDYKFNQTDLIYLWFSEGFLQDNGDLWKLGTAYYRELLLRNLLEDTNERYDQSKCKMHDLLWSFARYLGKDENLILREGDCIPNKTSFPKLRRLSIERNEVNSKVVNKEKWLRTLVINNEIPQTTLPEICRNVSSLRILDLRYSNISTLPDTLSNLVHLRYLDMTKSKIRIVPDSIGNLKSLVYLNFWNCKQLLALPHSITNLKQLRSLSFSMTKVDKIPVNLKNLENLIELHGFKPDKDSLKEFTSLDELENLSQLVSLHVYGLEQVSKLTTVKRAKLYTKEKLLYLRLQYTGLSWENQVLQTNQKKVTIEGVLNELCPPCSLERLKIENYFGKVLPKWLNVGTILPNLRYLSILNCNCFENLPLLGQLPNLDYLDISIAYSVVYVREEFLGINIKSEDSTSSCYVPAFPKLDTLRFEGLFNWIEWQWNKGLLAMPKLTTLTIEACPQLKSLPHGLTRQATSLKSLEIDGADNLITVENFLSVTTIILLQNKSLETISNLPSILQIIICDCPRIKTMENINKSLRWMRLLDFEMEVLPEYLMMVMPHKLRIDCSKELLQKISIQGIGGSEWQKFKHISYVKINTSDESLHVTYQKTPFSFTSNIN